MKRIMATALCCMLLASAHAAWGEPFTPGRETCGREHCFWETAMDISDEEAVWAMLTQPMTVFSGDPRGQTRVYAQPDLASQVGVVYFTTEGKDVEEIGVGLANAGIAVRAGFHCAPLAHRTAGTIATGTVRLSFSDWNTREEVGRFLAAVKGLLP